MAKEKNTPKADETAVTIGGEKFIVPIALILVAVIVAVIISSGNKKSPNQDETSVEGSTEESSDYGDYSDYITEGVSSNIDDDPYLGNKDTAKVAVIEFSDYLCYYCYRHTVQVMPDILSSYVDTGKAIYVFRDLQIHGEEAEKRAEIGECVNEVAGVEKFVEYHEKMKVVQFEDGEDDPDIYAIVDDLGVDSERVKACYDSGKYSDEVLADADDANSIGITGTPGFVVGKLNEDGSVDGLYISGALPFETFQIVIDGLLKE